MAGAAVAGWYFGLWMWLVLLWWICVWMWLGLFKKKDLKEKRNHIRTNEPKWKPNKRKGTNRKEDVAGAAVAGWNLGVWMWLVLLWWCGVWMWMVLLRNKT